MKAENPINMSDISLAWGLGDCTRSGMFDYKSMAGRPLQKQGYRGDPKPDSRGDPKPDSKLYRVEGLGLREIPELALNVGIIFTPAETPE